MAARRLIAEFVLPPGTGKAIELLKGQIVRVEQIDGGQCADFNCFNLHDYKECLHTGRTRLIEGMRLTTGNFLWSAPPRERPIVYIFDDTARINDTMYPRCTAVLFENLFGLPQHTNCQDIQAEAQREYGLTPDDVHDSFNLFMNTGFDEHGNPFIASQTARPGDYIELLALIDLLAVPNVCGADLTITSDFTTRPLKVVVYQAGDDDLAQVPPVRKLRTQVTPADFKLKQIKADRELRRDPGYSPDFAHVPVRFEDVTVDLDDDEMALLEAMTATGRYGATAAEALRFILFAWWNEAFLGIQTRLGRP
jgi:uncharacterized protein YcgI (DUF1989 family)